MSKILSIDPGTIESAWLYYDATKLPISFAKVPNEQVFNEISGRHIDTLAIEVVCSFGMPVGEAVFTTVIWIGRFMQYWVDRNKGFERIRPIKRKEVCMHLCGNTRAKDPNIRQVLMDRYGSMRDVAIGVKAKPGPLYGISKDMWSALGIAITAAETVPPIPEPVVPKAKKKKKEPVCNPPSLMTL
jgi:hypothetical protein